MMVIYLKKNLPQTQAFIYRKFLNDIAETVQYQFLFLWLKYSYFAFIFFRILRKAHYLDGHQFLIRFRFDTVSGYRLALLVAFFQEN